MDKPKFYSSTSSVLTLEIESACDALQDFLSRGTTKKNDNLLKLKHSALRRIKEDMVSFERLCEAGVFEELDDGGVILGLDAKGKPVLNVPKQEPNLNDKIATLSRRKRMLGEEMEVMMGMKEAMLGAHEEALKQVAKTASVSREVELIKVKQVTAGAKRLKHLVQCCNEVQSSLPGTGVSVETEFSKHRENMPSARDLASLEELLS